VKSVRWRCCSSRTSCPGSSNGFRLDRTCRSRYLKMRTCRCADAPAEWIVFEINRAATRQRDARQSIFKVPNITGRACGVGAGRGVAVVIVSDSVRDYRAPRGPSAAKHQWAVPSTGLSLLDRAHHPSSILRVQYPVDGLRNLGAALGYQQSLRLGLVSSDICRRTGRIGCALGSRLSSLAGS